MPPYIYEFTSAEFGRNAEGQLQVTNGGLDRDPPNQPVLVVQVSICPNVKDAGHLTYLRPSVSNAKDLLDQLFLFPRLF